MTEEKCEFYNDHDANVAECEEYLDDRFLAIKTCEERTDCFFKKNKDCRFFQDGDCGECCVEDGEEYYFDGLSKCKDRNDCYYKQLQTAKEENEDLTQQNKQMREALSWLETLLRENYNDKENQIICVVFAYEKIQQVLKGGE